MTIASGIYPLVMILLLPTRLLYAEISVEALIEDANLEKGLVSARDFDAWRPPQKILVSDTRGMVERLQHAFPRLEVVGVRTEKEAALEISNADAIIGFCNEDIVHKADRLVWIHVLRAGVESCTSVPAVRAGNYLVTNMQKMSAPTIGEHAIALMLSVTFGLPPYAKAMQDGVWDRSIARQHDVTPISGKTMLIAGLGGIGTATARRADGLGMRVVATRNSSRRGPAYVDYVGLSHELLELAAEADVVVNALPLTNETKALFDREFFEAVKPGAIFINVGRGGSVVTGDLVAALEVGTLRGAGLDVTDPEPLPPEHPLWQFDNVIITPHIAGAGTDSSHRPVLVEENVRRFIAGDALLNVVDPALGY